MSNFYTRTHNHINLLSVTKDVLLKLSMLNTSRAMGPDKIHTWILKGRHGLCKPLSVLFLIFHLKAESFLQNGSKLMLQQFFRQAPDMILTIIVLTSQLCEVLESFISSIV